MVVTGLCIPPCSIYSLAYLLWLLRLVIERVLLIIGLSSIQSDLLGWFRTSVSHRQHSWCEHYMGIDRATQGTQTKTHLHLPYVCMYVFSFMLISNLSSLVFQLNAAVTVQILIDVFSVSGIVHYGTAGSSNDSISFGDVSVPKLVAFTGAWTWKVPPPKLL